MRVLHVRTLMLGAAVGAAVALLLDPKTGRRRRALVRDKLGHGARVLGRTARRRARAVPGPVRGALHDAAERAPWHTTPPPPDEAQFIKDRVESELGRDPAIALGSINIDAADGIVRVRGTVADAQTAERIVQRAAAVEGVRAVQSLLHTPDGAPAGGEAGDTSLLHGEPRAAVLAEAVQRRLTERWPEIGDADILASDGHLGRLTDLICERTGETPATVRAALDEILLTAV